MMPATERSTPNTTLEGVSENRVDVTGGPFGQVLVQHTEQVSASTVLTDLGLFEGEYFLVTRPPIREC